MEATERPLRDPAIAPHSMLLIPPVTRLTAQQKEYAAAAALDGHSTAAIAASLQPSASTIRRATNAALAATDSEHVPQHTASNANTALDTEQEDLLATTLRTAEDEGNGLNRKEARSLAAQLFPDVNCKWSDDWLTLFLARNGLTTHNTKGNKTRRYYTTAQYVSTIIGGWTAYRAWRTAFPGGIVMNIDETHIPLTPQHYATIGPIGKPATRPLLQPIATATTSVTFAITLNGCVLPPMVVLKRPSRDGAAALELSPPRFCFVQWSDSGFSTVDTLSAYLRFLCAALRPFGPIRLVMDRGSVHTSALMEGICASIGVEYFLLPSYSTPFLQPLDSTVNANFKRRISLLRLDTQRTHTALSARQTRDTIIHAIETAASAITKDDVRAGFDRTGLRRMEPSHKPGEHTPSNVIIRVGNLTANTEHFTEPTVDTTIEPDPPTDATFPAIPYAPMPPSLPVTSLLHPTVPAPPPFGTLSHRSKAVSVDATNAPLFEKYVYKPKNPPRASEPSTATASTSAIVPAVDVRIVIPPAPILPPPVSSLIDSKHCTSAVDYVAPKPPTVSATAAPVPTATAITNTVETRHNPPRKRRRPNKAPVSAVSALRRVRPKA